MITISQGDLHPSACLWHGVKQWPLSLITSPVYRNPMSDKGLILCSNDNFFRYNNDKMNDRSGDYGTRGSMWYAGSWHPLNNKYRRVCVSKLISEIFELDWRTTLSKDSCSMSTSIYFWVQVMDAALSWLQELWLLSMKSASQSYLLQVKFIPKIRVALPGISGLLPFLP